MDAIDRINKKMGKESIKLASEGFKRPWKMCSRKTKVPATQPYGKIFQLLIKYNNVRQELMVTVIFYKNK